MKNTLYLVLVLLFASCASFQVSTLNYDPIYGPDGTEIKVDTIENEFQLARKLRNDFNFRYDFAQYALSQPQSFDWRFNRMSRFMGMHRYGYNQHSIFGTNTWGYSNMWNRSQMWNDWVWGYPYGNGMGWSYSWGNNSWSSNSWNNPYGWNNWNGWGNGYGYNAWHQLGGIYGRQQNVAYNSGRRMSQSDREGLAAMGNSRIATTVTNNRVLNNNTRIIKNKPLKDELVITDLDQYYRDLIKNGNGKEIKIYTNPNNVPKIIRNNNNNNKPRIIRNNNNNNNVKIYNRTPIRSNNNNNSRPIINSRPTNRSSGNTSTSTSRSSNNVRGSGKNK